MGLGSTFPTNPDLADILGDAGFDFESFYFLDSFGSQISGLGPAWAWLGASLVPAWAHPLGPGLGPPTGPLGGPGEPLCWAGGPSGGHKMWHCRSHPQPLLSGMLMLIAARAPCDIFDP